MLVISRYFSSTLLKIGVRFLHLDLSQPATILLDVRKTDIQVWRCYFFTLTTIWGTFLTCLRAEVTVKWSLAPGELIINNLMGHCWYLSGGNRVCIPSQYLDYASCLGVLLSSKVKKNEHEHFPITFVINSPLSQSFMTVFSSESLKTKHLFQIE